MTVRVYLDPVRTAGCGPTPSQHVRSLHERHLAPFGEEAADEITLLDGEPDLPLVSEDQRVGIAGRLVGHLELYDLARLGAAARRPSTGTIALWRLSYISPKN